MRVLRIILAILAAGAIARSVSAQRAPGEVLNRGVILYEELQLERAVTLLREVMSPSNVAVTTEQRVQAMKYLGAAFALLAIAIPRSPIFDGYGARSLCGSRPGGVPAQERQLFAIARQRAFRGGLCEPCRTALLRPPGRVSLRFVTTQRARVQALVRRAGTWSPSAASAGPPRVRRVALGWARSEWSAAGAGSLPARRHANATTDSAERHALAAIRCSYDHAPLEDSMSSTRHPSSPSGGLRRSPARTSRQGWRSPRFAVAVPSVIGHGELSGRGSTRRHGERCRRRARLRVPVLRQRLGPSANVLENARRMRRTHVSTARSESGNAGLLAGHA